MEIKTKYNIGDKCKVIKNLLSPKSIGHTVIIDGVAVEKEGRIIYNAHIEGYEQINCLCAETCLELLTEENNGK